MQLDKREDISLTGNGKLIPSATDGTSGAPEPELDLLSNILEVFNERFGDINWGEDDKIKRTLDNISEDVISDEEL